MEDDTCDGFGRWVGEARRGDAEAFRRLVDQFWPPVVRSVRRIVGDHHLAQDLTQEAFLRAHDNLRALDREVNFLRWVLRIARNVAVDRLRAARRLPEVELCEPDALPHVVNEAPPDEGDLLEQGASARVWSAIAALPERDRRLLLLRYGRGLSHRQIARECGLTPGGVKIALHRGRHRLSSLLDEPAAASA